MTLELNKLVFVTTKDYILTTICTQEEESYHGLSMKEHFHAASYVQNQGQKIFHLGFSNDIKVELANCEYLGMLVRNQCLPPQQSSQSSTPQGHYFCKQTEIQLLKKRSFDKNRNSTIIVVKQQTRQKDSNGFFP